MTRDQVIMEIHLERVRQYKLQKQGKFKYTAFDAPSDGQRLAILVEEIGEIAKAINEMPARTVSANEYLRTELIQTAAVCVAWLESL